MADPTTTNIGLAVPSRGSDTGTWDTPLNNNSVALDGYLGGVLNLSLGAATTIALTTAGASLTPGGGPFQTANSLIKLSGSLSGNQVIQLPQPGIYRFQNACTVGSNYVQIAPSAGTGLAVGLPDGEQWHVHYDGTNCWLLGLPHVGTFIDMCCATTPAWMNAFTNAAYLLCNGATYSVATFPALSARLGSTYGGNGITTFGVPDFQNRYFIPMDFGGNLRVTVASAGIDGTAFGATGGSQNPQQHTHAATVSEGSGHSHVESYVTTPFAQGGGTIGVFSSSIGGTAATTATQNATTGLTVTNAAAGAGSSGNIPPGIVGGMRFIKT